MWCDLGKSKATIAVICVLTVSTVISGTAFAARQRNYKPQEFRAVLRGLGYKVTVTNDSLTDEETKKAISEFQKGYRLNVDGQAGPKTQAFAANIVQILQGNLNAVLKPNPLLPRDQFYSTRLEELVKEYQKKNQLTETGIADLALRQKLNEEAKTVIGLPTTPTATPMAKPTATPTAKPTVKPTAKPTATPSPTATPTPTAKPTATPSPTATPTPTPTP
ncbi:peptidoglycan-binding protein [Anabaena lutea]|uniref:Peptidoglycan-binding protein n=1 Tax=Anabaena lutea FACHB-196 TaxID=2692881 RepID=A0ABR8FC31_9NOST|nr:peptidoglycan-binding protein [Anabaena lutea]MBD2567777.1 peptidoglycan-binding protein [Anabaena lutea FACHB-196]